MSPRLDGAREASLSRWLALTPFILQKSRMRRRARTDLCGGRSAMGVPTATLHTGPHEFLVADNSPNPSVLDHPRSTDLYTFLRRSLEAWAKISWPQGRSERPFTLKLESRLFPIPLQFEILRSER